MNGRTPVDDGNGNKVPLREYIEGILRERDRALAVAEKNMERRLDALNELRSEVTMDRLQFLRVDVYDEKHARIEADLEDLERTVRLETAANTKALSQRIDGLESWRLKATGVFLVLVPLAGVIGAAIARIFGGSQ